MYNFKTYIFPTYYQKFSNASCDHKFINTNNPIVSQFSSEFDQHVATDVHLKISICSLCLSLVPNKSFSLAKTTGNNSNKNQY